MTRQALLLLAASCCMSLLYLTGLTRAQDAALPATVEFNRDIRPIFANNCATCHGPDTNKRKADLVLADEASVFKDRDGHRVIVPGKPSESELIARLTAADDEARMPPGAGKALSKREIELVRKWIEQGARYQRHWSLMPVQRPQIPAVENPPAGWPRNPIDSFVLARLRQEKLGPSSEADRRILIRRLSFDLIGLPPTPAEVDQFLADTSEKAYEKLVDRLLESPHFGERMAMYWLDLVRYADSIGYHSDNPRDVWPYRDWVIRAFNTNKPFDQFTIEQLAGDLLPNATTSQRVASGYNRLLQTTEEGGAQPKEYAAKYMADRIRNFGSAWLGATLGCCECHNHKFDNFTIKDFYSLQAFFADVQEAPVGRREAGMLVPTPQQAAELKRLDDRIALAGRELAEPTPELLAQATLTRTMTPLFDPALADFARYQRRKNELTASIPRSLVANAVAPRPIRVLPRGNWLDDSGEVVTPAIPQCLPQLETKAARPTRLDLAHWLVRRDNPLTARVFVNRLWKLYFGAGLCRSLEDFGAMGELPTHPELLDWLASEFMESTIATPDLRQPVPARWNVKHMIRLMVTSATYRQSSLCSKELRERDADNRLLARQARYRLDAEMVRDNALAISGLLVKQIGGASVKPYQPVGYWEYLNFPKRTYQHDHGSSQYRRGLYTHWQRTFLHPSMVAFDAPTREECTCERPRSNIPQQALVLLNDPTYVEAARVFAEQILKSGGTNAPDRLNWAYRQALSRSPKPDEQKILLTLLEKHYKSYAEDKQAASQLLATGEAPAPRDVDPALIAAWTSVARTLLNLHETVTRE